MEVNKPKIAVGIVILFFIFLMIQPITKKCIGEGKEKCNYLDEINLEYLFLFTIGIILLILIIQLNKRNVIIENILDVLIVK